MSLKCHMGISCHKKGPPNGEPPPPCPYGVRMVPISSPTEGKQALVTVVKEATDPALGVDLATVHPINENSCLHKVEDRVPVHTKLTAKL